MDVLAGLPLTPPLLELAGDPVLQLLDGVATDAQLNEMERQEISRGIAPGGVAREESSTAYCAPHEICNGAPRLPPLFTGTAARASAFPDTGLRICGPLSGIVVMIKRSELYDHRDPAGTQQRREYAQALLRRRLHSFTLALRSEAAQKPAPLAVRGI